MTGSDSKSQWFLKEVRYGVASNLQLNRSSGIGMVLRLRSSEIGMVLRLHSSEIGMVLRLHSSEIGMVLRLHSIVEHKRFAVVSQLNLPKCKRGFTVVFSVQYNLKITYLHTIASLVY